MSRLLTKPETIAAFTERGRELGGHRKMLPPADRSNDFLQFARTAPPTQHDPRKDPKRRAHQRRTRGSFFYLPRRARDQIYRYLLVSKGSYITLPPKTDRNNNNAMLGLVPQSDRVINTDIFLTCRKVGAEASKIFYNENAFRFSIPGNGYGLLSFRDFHVNLPRIRKCWLEIDHPRLDDTHTCATGSDWFKCLDLDQRFRNLVCRFAQALSNKNHAMEFLQIVIGTNPFDEKSLPLDWQEVLKPFGLVRHIKHVLVSGKPNPEFRQYLEDVMSRDEAWEFTPFAEWQAQTAMWTSKGIRGEEDRINLFNETVPRSVHLAPETKTKRLREAVARMEPQRGRGRPRKVQIIDIEDTGDESQMVRSGL